MSTTIKNRILVLFSILCLLQSSHQDVAHYFAQTPDYNYYQNHYPLFAQQTHLPANFQTGLPTLYGPPPNAENEFHANPLKPSEIVTPKPVAPVFSSTESTLPEIVENRSARDDPIFIPLFKQYLPPADDEERPNYESPQQGHPQHDTFNGGYIYQKPQQTSTTTTTPRPANTIVVADPPEFIVPINNDPVILPPISNDQPAVLPAPTQGYNYNVPSTALSQPSPGYLPPSKDQQHLQGRNVNTTFSLRLHIHEMRCLQHDTNTNGYLRAVFKIDNFLSTAPSADNDSSDKRCEVKMHKSFIVVGIAGEDFTRCGVQQCGTDLCFRLRFPAIRGMRTGSDNILTLHCKSQSRVAVKTHALKMGVSNDVQARSIGTYAKGGTQNSFRTHVELLRKTPQGYAKQLQTNEAVQLGEDLLLRAHVITGDGWNYTKLTDVSLQRISPSGEMLNHVQLITSQGCLNPSMKNICTQTPTFDAPLGQKLHFKAAMFQSMRSGEELIMSMRITGCLEYHDCYVNTEHCNSHTNLKRRRREMIIGSAHNNTEISEISRISFSVVMPETTSLESYFPTENFKANSKSLILYGSLGFVALLMFLGLFVSIKLRK